MIRLTVFFSGRVQGVGFRATVLDCTDGTAVTGFVHNLPDGRVEAVFEGEPAEIDEVMKRVVEQMETNVDAIERNDTAPTGGFVRFEIRP